MRIGIFTDSYKPYTSGVVRSIETTTAELRNLGYEVFIFAPSYPNYEKEEGVFRFASLPTPTYPDFAVALPFSVNINATVRELDLDVIHVHSPFTMGMLGWRCAKRHNLPLVFTYHTMYDQYVHYMPFARDLSRKVVLKLSGAFCDRCDLVIVPTGVIRDIVAKNTKTKVEVIPTGIDRKEFVSVDRGWLRRRYRISDQCKILLHLGRLGKEKNVAFLLQVYSEVVRKYSDTVFIIVGKGPESESLRELAHTMGIGEKVIFTGPLSREEVINSYAGADLFLFASLTETQGLVLGEAKCAGLPAVAISALGAAEMINDGEDGFLTSPDKKEFTKRVLQLLDDDELRRQMAKNALLMSEKISSESMAKKLVRAYEATISRKRKAAVM